MNEKIKKLSDQCWGHRIDGVLVDGHLHFDTEKFAGLIVLECADFLMNVADDHFLAEQLTEHFGLKE